MSSDNLRILLLGSGGREHALAWKLSHSPHVSSIVVAPGNGGTASLPKTSNASVSAEDFPALVELTKKEDINLVVVGPEAPLVAGVVDYFAKHAPSVKVFGPSESAARMEGSKTFSKDFMQRHKIPTAEYRNFGRYEEAKEYLERVKHRVVIKASGLAAGKGVIIPLSDQEAQDALKDIMLDKEFGSAGDEVVIEEFLEGDELSILSFSDGKTIKSLPASQDHKRIFDNDQGPNTGGMGTYAPIPIATKELLQEVDRTILQPTIDGMREEGFPFQGILFTGLMLTKTGIKVLEYNVRSGDPETQSVMPLLKSDLAEIMLACIDGRLDQVELEIEPKFAATVVIAAKGYPGDYPKGTPMTLDPQLPEGVVHFHAGTKLSDGKLVTSGGRVIASTATGSSLEEAVKSAYKGVDAIRFDGMQYRRDIAGRALKR